MRRDFLALMAAVVFGLTGGHGACAAPPPAPSWTGFYIGGDGGSGWGTTQGTAPISGSFRFRPINTVDPVIPFSIALPMAAVDYNGFLGGVDVGYNWQSGIWVLGVEGDFDGSSMEGNTACLLVLNCRVNHDWVADVTGRIGLVVFDDVLVFVKGGVAWADAQYSVGNSVTFGTPPTTFAVNASASGTLFGGLLGLGAAYRITPNLSAKVEYDHIEFGTQTFNFPITTTPPVTGLPTVAVQIHDSMNIFKVGVDYKFWSATW
jgi:outer membrane immunogenic protein